VVYCTEVFPKLLLVNPFWLQNITTDPHVFADINILSRQWISKIKYLYLRTDFR